MSRPWLLRPYQPVRSDYLQIDYVKGNWLFSFEANPLSETVQFGTVNPVAMTQQIFVDEQPQYYAFANDTARLTGAEVFAAHAANQNDE